MRLKLMSGLKCPQWVREKRERAAARQGMDFKDLKTDSLTLFAGLAMREARTRSSALAAAFRRIEIVAQGRYGEHRPDFRLSMMLAPGVEVSIHDCWNHEDASGTSLADTVVELIDAAERIFDERFRTIETLREVRSTLSKECAKGRRRGLPYRALDVSLEPFGTDGHDIPVVKVVVSVVGALRALDEAAFLVESGADVVDAFNEMREQQEQLLSIRDQLASVGADIAIDPVALAALEDAGVDLRTTIEDLQSSKIIDVDARHGRLVLYVKDGVVSGNVPLGQGRRWLDGRLHLPKAHDPSWDDIEGRRLDQLVPHDYFAPGLEVHHVIEMGEVVMFCVRMQPVALSLGQSKRAA